VLWRICGVECTGVGCVLSLPSGRLAVPAAHDALQPRQLPTRSTRHPWQTTLRITTKLSSVYGLPIISTVNEHSSSCRTRCLSLQHFLLYVGHLPRCDLRRGQLRDKRTTKHDIQAHNVLLNTGFFIIRSQSARQSRTTASPLFASLLRDQPPSINSICDPGQRLIVPMWHLKSRNLRP
jgi:hypothetical protein